MKNNHALSAEEAGWHLSRYNITAPRPEDDAVLIANTFRGSCEVFSASLFTRMTQLDQEPADSALIRRASLCGILTKIDERALLEAGARISAGASETAALTICPTMACNFDCPYCFERHNGGRMTNQVQEDVVSLARRMIQTARAKRLTVNWFGGEPLLALDIISSLTEKLRIIAEQSGAVYEAHLITNGYLLTQETVNVLSRASIKSVQITLDGLGDTHNATRQLPGGAPTFARITENLKTVKMPFRINIRHNVHAGNEQEKRPLQEYVRLLSAESGNQLYYYPSAVQDNPAAEKRHSQVELLCGSSASEFELFRHHWHPHTKSKVFCGANTMFNIGVDEKGNLYKCWEAVDNPERSFGRASIWDPAMAFRTADHPDQLTCYLNAAPPLDDPECRECVWLPICRGGCPARRIYDRKACIAFKDEPEKYVLALYQTKILKP